MASVDVKANANILRLRRGKTTRIPLTPQVEALAGKGKLTILAVHEATKPAPKRRRRSTAASSDDTGGDNTESGSADDDSADDDGGGDADAET